MADQETKRTRGMSMLASGIPRDVISKELDVSSRTVRNWANRPASDRQSRRTHQGRRRLTAQESRQLVELVVTQPPRETLKLNKYSPGWTTVQRLIADR
jgi:transposase